MDWPLYQELAKLEPFGMGNPTPVFGVRGLRLVAPPRVLQEKHLKLRVGQAGRTLDAIGWGWAARAQALAAGQQVDLAVTLEQNNYQDVASLQLVVRDLVTSEGVDNSWRRQD
jgi:single-stranded-DNA-specific exonuclease